MPRSQHANRGRPRVVKALDPVQDRSDLQIIIEAGVNRIHGPVVTRLGRRDQLGRGGEHARRVDLGRRELIETLAGGTADDLIGRVLVRPGRAHAGGMDDFHDGRRIVLQVLVRVHRRARAVDQPQRQVRRVDVVGIDQATAVELGQIVIERLEVSGFGARLPLTVASGRI